MPVQYDEVVNALNRDEPDYPGSASRFGADALPHLETIARGSDIMLASKAVYLAAMIDDAGADKIVGEAAAHAEPRMRVAAAGAAASRRSPPVAVLQQLTSDPDAGVRKMTLRTIESRSLHSLKAKVQSMASSDPEPQLRQAATRIGSQLR